VGSFGQDFAKGFFAVDGARDYTHASKVFRTNAYELKPRFKFLFHVTFTINTTIPALNAIFSNDDVTNLSYLVKTVSLPTYTFDTATMNQYNRKRLIQTKIKYNPVNITFHDDGGDNVRNMWYNYYAYYYKDASQKYGSTPNTNGSAGGSQNRQDGFGGWDRDIYSDNRQVNDWGFIGESYNDGTSSPSGKPPFFKDIRIAGFDKNHKYAEYVLINPIISSWQHDTYDYAQGGGLMQNTMTIDYETVKYYDKAPNKSAVGFANPSHYDTTISPIARPGSTNSIFGQGGLLDVVDGVANDLQSGSVLGLIGAVQKAGTFYNTNQQNGGFKKLLVSEATALGKDAIKQSIPGAVRSVANRADGWIFPTAQSPAFGTFTDNTALQNAAPKIPFTRRLGS
jgi:hypothetical protein